MKSLDTLWVKNVYLKEVLQMFGIIAVLSRKIGNWTTSLQAVLKRFRSVQNLVTRTFKGEKSCGYFSSTFLKKSDVKLASA